MRRAVLVAALLLAALAVLWDPASPPPVVQGPLSPAPTAAEESGVDGPLETAVRYPPVIARPARPRRRSGPTPVPRTPEALFPIEARAEVSGSPPREAPAHDEAVAGVDIASVDSVAGNEDPPAESTPVAPSASAAPPPSVLTPPVLTTGALQYAGGYQLTLTRETVTARLRAEALEGRVVLRVLVLVDGSVARVEVVESSGQLMLDEAAARAAESWIFLPATRGGMAIDAWAVIPVRFVVP